MKTKSNMLKKGKKVISLMLIAIMVTAPLMEMGVVAANEDDIMTATTVGIVESAAVGETATMVVHNGKNNDYSAWPESSPIVTIGEAATSISNRKSNVIDSEMKEGFRWRENEQATAPIFKVNLNNASFNMETQDIMFYLELPEGTSKFRMKDINANGKWPSPQGMRYKYLENNAAAWVDGGTSDEYKTFTLTDGFKGYVRLIVNSATNCGDYKTSTVNLTYFHIFMELFGEAYGTVTFGGVWFTSKNDSLFVSVDNGAAVKMGTRVEQGTVMKATTAGVTEGGVVGEKASMVVHNGKNNDYSAWLESTPIVTIGEKATNISNRKSNVIDSEIKEGFRWRANEQPTAPLFKVNLNNANFDMASQDLMFYIELPKGTSKLRIKDINADGKWPSPQGMRYKYLENDAVTWVDGGTSDEYKTFTLTDGFKGYVRLVVNSAVNCDEYKTDTVKLTYFQMFMELFGEGVGPVIFGGAWFVSKEDSLLVSVDGGMVTGMTGTKSQDVICAEEVRKLVNQVVIGGVTIADAKAVEQLEAALEKISNTGWQMLSVGERARANRIVTQYNQYRPQVTTTWWDTEKASAGYAGIRTKSVLDTTFAQKEGYSVSKCGTLMITGQDYSGEDAFTEETAGVRHIDVNNVQKSVTGLSWEAVYESNNATGFEQKIYFRTYVDYTNGNEFIRVWNLKIEKEDGTSVPYMMTSIKAEVGNDALPEGLLYGDVDGDGSIKEADAFEFRKFLVGATVLPNSRLADTVPDEILDVIDLVRLKKYFSNEEMLLGPYGTLLFLTKEEKMEMEFAASTAESDATLFTNPDRGFRLESYMTLSSSSINKKNITQWNSKFQAAADKINENLWAKPKLIQVYCYITDYKDTEVLPEIVFTNLETIFQTLQEENMKGVIRFAYQNSMETPEEQASQQIMLSHMDQIAKSGILEQNKHLIHAVEAGFLGAWGEWHSYPGHSWNNPEQITNADFDGAKILKGILDMVPEEIYVQVRYPGILELIDETDSDYKRLGLHNDAFFGYRSNSGWPYKELDNEAYLKTEEVSLSSPMGGECFWSSQWGTNEDVTAEQAIRLFSKFHQNSFSVFHNSFEGTAEVAGQGSGALWFATDREGDMSKWAKTSITQEQIDDWGAYVSPSYFKNAKGETAERNVFEYVRDHLGYRLEARELMVSGDISAGKTISTSMKLVNYGFSAAFNMTGEFVVLDENNQIVSRVEAGIPSSWNNFGQLTTHTVNANVVLPDRNGKYKIAYYLHNSNNEGAYFANDITREDGFNVLCDITINNAE